MTTGLVIQTGVAGQAASSSCGVGGNYFAGELYNPGSPQQWGTQADVSVESAPLCTGGASTDSTAWAMLASDNSASLYSQIGHLHKNYGNPSFPLRFFYEWARTGRFVQVLWGDPVYGNVYNYRVSTYGNPLRIHNLLDTQNPPCGGGGQGCATTDFSPFDGSSGWSGTNSEWFGETLHPGSDIAGTKTNPTHFTTAQHTDGSGWLNQTFTQVVSCPSFYHASTGGSTSAFTIWTDPSNHSSTCS